MLKSLIQFQNTLEFYWIQCEQRTYCEEVVKTNVERSIRFGKHRDPERIFVCLHVPFLRRNKRVEIKR